jgi:hypothetical protein
MHRTFHSRQVNRDDEAVLSRAVGVGSVDNLKSFVKRIDTLANVYGEKGFAEDDVKWFFKAKSDKEYARDYIDLLKETNYLKLKRNCESC